MLLFGVLPLGVHDAGVRWPSASQESEYDHTFLIIFVFFTCDLSALR